MSPDIRQDAQSLLQSLPLPSYIYSLQDGRVLGSNEAFCALLGYPMKEMREMLAPDLYDEAVRPEMWQLMRKLAPEGLGDRRFQTSNGTVLLATVRYRNSEFMNAKREFILTRLVVVISSQPEQKPTETHLPEEQPVDAA
jgi:PAS domain-containing protein